MRLVVGAGRSAGFACCIQVEKFTAQIRQLIEAEIQAAAGGGKKEEAEPLAVPAPVD